MTYYDLPSEQQNFHSDMILLARDVAVDQCSTSNINLVNMLNEKWTLKKLKALSKVSTTADPASQLLKKEIRFWKKHLFASAEFTQAFLKLEDDCRLRSKANARDKKALQQLTLTVLKLEFERWESLEK